MKGSADVSDIPQAEADSDTVKGVVWEGQLQDIAKNQLDSASLRRGNELGFGLEQHLIAEIYAYYRAFSVPQGEVSCQLASTGGNIEG
jgi:hypothetical protein